MRLARFGPFVTGCAVARMNALGVAQGEQGYTVASMQEAQA